MHSRKFFLMHSLKLTKEAAANIASLPTKKKRQVKDAIERLAKDPLLGKSLTKNLSGLYSYRSGDYRIIYKVLHRQILIIILTVGHRKDIYKKVSRKPF